MSSALSELGAPSDSAGGSVPGEGWVSCGSGPADQIGTPFLDHL